VSLFRGEPTKMLMTGTITPSFTPRSRTPVSRVQPPTIPSRPDSNTSLLEADGYRSRSDSVRSQAPPLPSRSSPAPARLSTSPNSSDPNSVLPKVRRDPPPRPTKPASEATTEQGPEPSFVPSTSIIDKIQQQRSLASTSSPVKPSALPPRPQPKVSMDTDGPPPDGLVTPVLPTQKSQPPLPIRKPVPTDSVAELSSSKPATASKPIIIGASGEGRKTGSVADQLKQWEQIGSQSTVKPSSSGSKSPTRTPLATSPTKRAAPVKRAKPDTLRKPSSNMSTSPA
jgi:hypothetical protein